MVNVDATGHAGAACAGTLLCIDPVSKISTVLLTNRVYPNATANMGTVHTARQQFNNAVLTVLQR
jgi:CubicO group peptidase (beta-lactamase class C family)